MRALFAKLRERYSPYVFGAVGAWLLTSHLKHVVVWASSNGVDLKAFFGAVFNFAAVTTAFMLSSFTLAMAPGGGFIEKIFSTRTFSLFLRYLAEALSFGFALTVASIPFMVYEIKDVTPIVRAIVFLWSFIGISATLGFIRITRIFIIWVSASAAAGRRKALHQSYISPN